MQISIDNVKPDDVSKKSLKVLDKKLQMLAEHAEFHVNINSVVGGGIHNPDDALVVGRSALELGFSATVGIIHDGDGQLRPLGERERAVYHEMKAMENRHFARLNFFQDAIAQGKPNHWRCRAGARYMYICEDGLVHYCSQQRGYPGKAARSVHARGHSPRISHRKTLRALLHGELRALRVVLRFFPRAADHQNRNDNGAESSGEDSVGEIKRSAGCHFTSLPVRSIHVCFRLWERDEPIGSCQPRRMAINRSPKQRTVPAAAAAADGRCSIRPITTTAAPIRAATA